jgi:DNA excision repair protein ERCC-2
VVDARCRDLTSGAACAKGRANPGSVPLCSFHEVCSDRRSNCWISSLTARGPQELENFEPGNLIPQGIWTLADVSEYGKKYGTCPYFTIRRMVG